MVINLLLSDLKFAYSKEGVKFACVVSSCLTAIRRTRSIFSLYILIINKNNFIYYIAAFLRSWRFIKQCVKLLQSAIRTIRKYIAYYCKCLTSKSLRALARDPTFSCSANTIEVCFFSPVSSWCFCVKQYHFSFLQA